MGMGIGLMQLVTLFRTVLSGMESEKEYLD